MLFQIMSGYIMLVDVMSY